MALKIDRRKRTRVRCTECGSTRVRGIATGYFDGRLMIDDDGHVYVGDGAWETHDEYRVESGSVVCENCGNGRYRVEGAPSALNQPGSDEHGRRNEA